MSLVTQVMKVQEPQMKSCATLSTKFRLKSIKASSNSYKPESSVTSSLGPTPWVEPVCTIQLKLSLVLWIQLQIAPDSKSQSIAEGAVNDEIC